MCKIFLKIMILFFMNFYKIVLVRDENTDFLKTPSGLIIGKLV
ncbi:hypothetical protein CP04DC42_0171 [Chlamydia psittaci 04DC42]|nr:hypothetical protein CP04DC42_0171 [Chlamydia psittaci 04DC42]KPZ39654.1 hypothetical protein GWI_00875 [Chlamydia psittaci str. Frances]KXH24824.1 hypothetical protein P059_00875 [Chlamydia psittaci UGA]